MKKLLLILLILTFSSCGLFDEIDKCETLDEVRNSTSSIGVTVYTLEHARINNITVKIETWKVHCNGSIGKPPGDTMTGITGAGSADTGFYGNFYNYGYKYQTLHDKVHFKATLSKNGQYISEMENIYSYNHPAPSWIHMKIDIDKKWKDKRP